MRMREHQRAHARSHKIIRSFAFEQPKSEQLKSKKKIITRQLTSINFNQTNHQPKIMDQLYSLNMGLTTLEEHLSQTNPLQVALYEPPAQPPTPSPSPTPTAAPQQILKIVKFVKRAKETLYECLMEDGSKEHRPSKQLEGHPALNHFRKQLRIDQNRRAYKRRQAIKAASSQPPTNQPTEPPMDLILL